MFKNQKGVIPIILLVAILTITSIVAGGALITVKTQQAKNSAQATTKPSPKPPKQKFPLQSSKAIPIVATPSATISPSSDMLTYRDSQYGFEFQYPKAISFEKNYGEIIVDKQIHIWASEVESFNCFRHTPAPGQLPSPCLGYDSVENIKVNGYDAEKFLATFPNYGAPVNFETVMFHKGNYYYHFEIRELENLAEAEFGREAGPIPQAKRELFNQILSTFKFTN